MATAQVVYLATKFMSRGRYIRNGIKRLKNHEVLGANLFSAADCL